MANPVWPDGCQGPSQCAAVRECLFRNCWHALVRRGAEAKRMPWSRPRALAPSPAAEAYVRALIAAWEQSTKAAAPPRPPIRARPLDEDQLAALYAGMGPRGQTRLALLGR